MVMKLTEGAIADLIEGRKVENPIVQVLAIKLVEGKDSNDRYRIQISDGTQSYDLVTLALQLHPLVLEKHLVKFSVIRIENMVIHHQKNSKTVIIVTEMTVLCVEGEDLKRMIGNPAPYKPFTPDPTLSYVPFSILADETPKEDHPIQPNMHLPPKKPRYSTDVKSTGIQHQEKSLEPTPGSSSSVTVNLQPSPKAPPITATTIIPLTLNAPLASTTRNYVPIEGITPYSGKITINARVIKKSEVRRWENATSRGQYFNIDILDESGEIRMTGFESSVDKYYDKIKENEVYTFYNFQIKNADKTFSSNNHYCELTFTPNTEVIPSPDPNQVPMIPKIAFTKIIDILKLDKDSIISIIGICTKVWEVQKVTTSRTNKELSKRDICIIDQSNTEVFVTLWGKQAEDFNMEPNSVILIRSAKVGEYCGKNLSMTFNELLKINPDIPEAHKVRKWYWSDGVKMKPKCISGNMEEKIMNAPWKMLKELKDVDPFYRAIGYYFRIKVSIVDIDKENPLYKACPTPRCGKKLIENPGPKLYCGKCKQEIRSFKWRLLLQITFSDGVDTVVATCFNDESEKILSLTVDEMRGKYDVTKPQEFMKLIDQVKQRKFLATLRCKEEKVNDAVRLQYTVTTIEHDKC